MGLALLAAGVVFQSPARWLVAIPGRRRQYALCPCDAQGESKEMRKPRAPLTYASAAAGLAISALIGASVGVGGYTFVYAKGGSYLTNDPAACANCHVMRQHYDGWQKSSHHTVAVCNDCHTPHSLIPKYLTKAENGFHHSLAFTSGEFHEPIRAKAKSRTVVEAQCRHCHAELTAGIEHGGEAISCTRCHADVGHALTD
jgi:cytochrome c nitrite reductase small subunit